MLFTTAFLFFSLLFSIQAGGQTRPAVLETAEDYLLYQSEVYFSFERPSDEVLAWLHRYISIDEITRHSVTAYAGREGFAAFTTLGITYQVETPPGMVDFDLNMLHVDDLMQKDLIGNWNFYPTYEAYVALMHQFAEDFPDLVEIYSIGESVLGRELLFARIGPQPGVQRAVPRVMYTSTIHGDETTGFILSLRLIHHLASLYGQDPDITQLLDQVEVWICPNENPDGTYRNNNATITGATRSNWNGVDLNRNYPNPVQSISNQQPETLAMMQFTDTMHFSLSANMHGGIELVNYPFDSWLSSQQTHADHNWWQFTMHEYVDTVHQYSPSNYMRGMGGGVTHGGDWYVVYGSRQDYMNYYLSTREFTLELSNIKLLPPAQLPAHWEYNYRSLINYIRQATFGIHGQVTDALSGEPLQASITVLNHDVLNSQVHSRLPHGFFSRPIEQGTWTLLVEAEGYPPLEISGVQTQNYQTNWLDVQLGGSLYADFGVSSGRIPAGGFADFFDQSHGEDYSLQWTFQGAEPALSQMTNPVHVVYPQAGNWDVSLQITADGDQDTRFRPAYMQVMPLEPDQATHLMHNGVLALSSGTFYDSGGAGAPYSNNEHYTLSFIPAVQGDRLAADFTTFHVEAHSNCQYDWLKACDGPDTSYPLMGTWCGTNSPGHLTGSSESGALSFEFHSDGSMTESGWTAVISSEPVWRRLYIEIFGQGAYQLQSSPLSGDNPYRFAWGDNVQLSVEEDFAATFSHWIVNGEYIPNPQLSLDMDQHYLLEMHFETIEGPRIAFDSDSLSFPTVVTGSFGSSTMEFHYANVGNQILEITLVDITGDGVFSTTLPLEWNTPLEDLAPGEQAFLLLEFLPVSPGEYWGELILQTNDPAHPEVIVSLYGEALPSGAMIGLVTTGLNFGSVPINEAASLNLTLRNSGDTDLIIEELLFSDDVFGTDVSFPLVVEPGLLSFIDIAIEFAPREVLPYEAMLHFVSNAVNNDQLSVALSGEGDYGTFSDTPHNAVDLTMYPNPSGGEAMLRWELESSASLAFALYDMQGRLLRHSALMDFEAGPRQLDLSHWVRELSPGLYFLRMEGVNLNAALRFLRQ